MEALETRFRANLFNSITGIKSVCLIGTKNESNRLNLAVFSSVTHLGSNPPLFGMVVRPPQDVERHTWNNIQSQQQYTINVVQRSFVHKAHQTSAKYDDFTSEFDAVGLTPSFINGAIAPAVKESEISLWLHYKQHVVLPNQTIFVIGEVEQLSISNSYLFDDGTVDHDQSNSIGVSGLDTYYTLQLYERFPYARPTHEKNSKI